MLDSDMLVDDYVQISKKDKDEIDKVGSDV